MFLLIYAIQIYSFIVIGRVLLSWFPNVDPNHPVAHFLYEATEPVLMPIRRFMQEQFGGQMGMFDFSPLILLVSLSLLQRILIGL